MSEEPRLRLENLKTTLAEVRGLMGDSDGAVARWGERVEKVLDGSGERFRVAVAGTVKSGKTTLVNALIGRDLLRRGAGIVTSLVTRVRPGNQLRANILLKGWGAINREVTDAALFLGLLEEVAGLDLRDDGWRGSLKEKIKQLDGGAVSEDGGIEKNYLLLKAYLEGYDRVAARVGEDASEIALGEAEFGEHREFAGHDSLAVFVDDLVLEIPGLSFGGTYEIADCQGYDSPNPRHREKVQEYMLGCHLVVYVVSSRIGLRQADLIFLRDLESMGLLENTLIVLNVDLAEHPTSEDLISIRDRVAEELRSLCGEVRIHSFSALRSLLETLEGEAGQLDRRDLLMLEIWKESPAASIDESAEFLTGLKIQVGGGREARLAELYERTFDRCARTLGTRLDLALETLNEKHEDFRENSEALENARETVENSLDDFNSSMDGLVAKVRGHMFARIDKCFHPSGGTLAGELQKHIRILDGKMDSVDSSDKKKIFGHLSFILQDMRQSLHRYKIETLNAMAVNEIRTIWSEASSELADTAHRSAQTLLLSAEAYRLKAAELGLDVPDALELPPAPTAKKRTIPLLSAVKGGGETTTAEQVLTFASTWAFKLATGWATRLFRKKESEDFYSGLLDQGGEAARKLLLDEAHSDLLQYNEQLKYQVLGKGIESLAEGWREGYSELVDQIVIDLEKLAIDIKRADSEGERLLPALRRLRSSLDQRAA